jgi:CheY-like chemotaxis protein
VTDAPVDILLAEDNPADAELVCEALGSEHPIGSVRLVHDGAEALEFLFCRGTYAGRSFDSPPRLVLLDIKLPKIGGLEILAALKSDPRTRAIPVVMFTSSRMERDVVASYRLGVNAYVQKPVQFARFREVVRLLGRFWLETNEAPPPEAFGRRGVA